MEEKISIIKLTDPDVDGCGTDVSLLIKVKGSKAIDNTVAKEMRAAARSYRMANPEYFTSDDLFRVACDELKKLGYEIIEYCNEDAEIILD